MAKKPNNQPDPEIVAISDVYGALKMLAPDAQSRVLSYVAGKLKIATHEIHLEQEQREKTTEVGRNEKPDAESMGEEGDHLEGISPVAKRWMARNGLEASKLSMVFSLGVDEIDLIAKTVPGKNMKERMRSVFLLKGVASYLGAGAARFTHEQIKEACLHYDAFDAAHFALHLKSLASEVSGSKDTGYTLTARGLANATEMVKSITPADKAG